MHVALGDYFWRMLHPIKINSILGLAVMLSLLIFAPQPSFANCKNSGGSSGSNKVGSQVNGNSVTICASAVSVVPARSTKVTAQITKPTRTLANPIAKQIGKPIAKAVSRPVSKSAPKSVTKPAVKIVAKPKPSTFKTKSVAKTVSKPSSANKTSAAANFTPAAAEGSVYPSNQLAVGQEASFVSNAVQHYRTGTLLNLPTEVRFTPLTVEWDFGDGRTAAGASLGYAFSTPGIHDVRVRVVYAISYRIKGSSIWIAEPESITLADEIQVLVSANSSFDYNPSQTQEPNQRVLLVGSDCLSSPGSFGCN